MYISSKSLEGDVASLTPPFLSISLFVIKIKYKQIQIQR